VQLVDGAAVLGNEARITGNVTGASG